MAAISFRQVATPLGRLICIALLAAGAYADEPLRLGTPVAIAKSNNR